MSIYPLNNAFVSTFVKGRGFDWEIDTGAQGLKGRNELYSAVIISLFTDRRANNDDTLPTGETCQRGWWGDALDSERPIGSRLWLLSKAKSFNETLSLARQYTEEALQWLIDKGVVKSLDVTTEYVGPNCMCINVVFTSNCGQQDNFSFSGERQSNYCWAWCEVEDE